MLVDSHCHLNYPEFVEDFPAVLARAREAGVGVMQTICTRWEEFEAIRGIAQGEEGVYCSVGIHPHHAGESLFVTTEMLVERCALPEVIGIGETGLDYYYEHSPRAAQQELFRAHIRAAQETQLPLIVHTRDADEDTVAMLQEGMREKAFPGLIHCFSSSQWLGEACLEMGLYISISGIVTFKKSEELREAVRVFPLERLLVETDAPYLAPMPHRGKRNEPSFVRHTAEELARVRGVSLEEVGRVTTDNFFRLFSKVER